MDFVRSWNKLVLLRMYLVVVRVVPGDIRSTAAYFVTCTSRIYDHILNDTTNNAQMLKDQKPKGGVRVPFVARTDTSRLHLRCHRPELPGRFAHDWPPAPQSTCEYIRVDRLVYHADVEGGKELSRRSYTLIVNTYGGFAHDG